MDSRDSLMQRLGTDGRYGHIVFGCFKGRSGHYVQEMRGWVQDSAYEAARFEAAAQFTGGCQEFEARIAASEEEPWFVLAFPDYRGDRRPGSHTDYYLCTPQEEKAAIAGIIRADPQVMIDLFKRQFPKYDRSAGSLRIKEILV